MDSYLTIEKAAFGELKVLNSRFICRAFPVEMKDEITEKIGEVRKKYYDASHHPYAWRTDPEGKEYKSSDDGEPSGTAGKPILEAIDKFSLTNVLLVTARYFGGTKLGTGGLRRAFHESAELCLKNAKITEKFITQKIYIESDYSFMGSLMKLIEREHLKLAENNSDEKCRLLIDVRLSQAERVKAEIVNLTNGKAVIC